MAGSKGGGGGGKGGSFTPPANQYGGGYGTGYYNPQPRLPQAPYNPMMDVYGSSQNVMQPMMGYYNQFPAGGSNYRPYQPQPQPVPPPEDERIFIPAPTVPGPIGGQGGQTGFPIGSQPNTDFNNYNMNDIATAVNRSQFGDYYPVYRQPPSNPTYLPVSDTPVENQGYAFTGDLSSLTNQMRGGQAANEPSMALNQQGPRIATQMAAPPQFTATRTRPDGYPVSAVNMPILDAADRRGGKGRDSGPRSGYVKHSQPQPQVAPIADPGFGGYDQNARAMMYGAPSIMFGGFR